MQSELEALDSVVREPVRPLAAVIGGAKISSKVGVLQNLLEVADEFLIGGGMANTFFRAQGKETGGSLVEADKIEVARDFMEAAERRGRKVFLPLDVVVVERIESDSPSRVVPSDRVPEGWSIVDIGPETVREFTRVLADAGTVIWNGPMGIFEMPPFAAGTRGVAAALAESAARTIVGGGDSVAAVEQMGLADKIYHISTGGGASLEYLEGRELPGVAVLQDQDSVV
jgi:phosphoglycerate kinase